LSIFGCQLKAEDFVPPWFCKGRLPGKLKLKLDASAAISKLFESIDFELQGLLHVLTCHLGNG
jgi:hypothetical protein